MSVVTFRSRESRFALRPLTIEDLPMLHEWLNRPHVRAWWDGEISFEQVVEEYRPDRDVETVQRFVASLGDRPTGYVQVYDVMRADPEWWRDETDPGARGIDQFLANESDLGKGLGTTLVVEILRELFRDPAVTKVQVDPSPDNARAIRVYEKAGFRQVGPVTTPDGPAVLMVIRRDAQPTR